MSGRDALNPDKRVGMIFFLRVYGINAFRKYDAEKIISFAFLK